MTSPARILRLYADLESAYGKLLVCAKREDWESTDAIGKDVDAIIAELSALEPGIALDPATMQAKTVLIEKTLASIAELRSIAEPARASNAALLAEGALRSKLANTYGV